MANEAVATFLGQTALFRGCNPAVITKVAPAVEQREIPWGHVLMQPGQPVTGVGILFAGRASVRMGGTQLEDVAPGDSFGEINILLGGMTSLSVMAEEDCRLFFMRKEHFEQVLNAVPAVAQAVARKLAASYIKGITSGQLGGMSGAAAAISPALAGATLPPPQPGGAAPPPGLDGKPSVRFVEVSAYNLTPKLIEMLPVRFIHQHRVLPLDLRDKTLTIGMVNPASPEAKTELRRILQSVDPDFVAISIDDFQQTVTRMKIEAPEKLVHSSHSLRHARIEYTTERRKEQEKAQLAMGEEVTGLLDRIFIEGVERGASDIHIEPEAQNLRVRYRVQGLMIERTEQIPLGLSAPLTARIKVLAELDITERRVPQDGRIAATIGTRELNFRISTLATGRGEKIVMRILDPTDVMRPLEQIFVDPQVVETVARAISVPHGAVFVAGPTGSGKSSTLYSMINRRKVSRPDNNIVTVEDPVEFQFAGITQTPLNVKVGLDYPTALRALMRQDPDVIMIGELRDAVSSSIAVEAALTGHLVLSSIHGSQSVAVLQRLGHFDIAPVILSQALNVVIVQRLAPRLCANCVREDDVSPAMLDNLKVAHLVDKSAPTSIKLPRPVGCDACDRTGRKGRVAVVEVLSLQEDMRAVLASGAPPVELLARAAEANQFHSFNKYARMLIAKRLLAPADAMQAVAE